MSTVHGQSQNAPSKSAPGNVSTQPSKPVVQPDVAVNTKVNLPQEQSSFDGVVNDLLQNLPVPGLFDDTEGGPVLFEATEHQSIGDAVKLTLANGETVVAGQETLRTIDKVNLQFGRIVSMAGDFYTNRRLHLGGLIGDYPPICGAFYKSDESDKDKAASQRYKNMIDAMLKNTDGYLAPLAALLDRETVGIKDALKKDGQAAQAYHHTHPSFHGHLDEIPKDIEFQKATGKLGAIVDGAYAKMAWVNADHFGDDAVTCYTVGHKIACELASAAGTRFGSDPKTAAQGLKEAYFVDATACHYLTDLFSTGHLRAPRRAFHLDDWTITGLIGAQNLAFSKEDDQVVCYDTLSRYVHDDDSACGLLVRNANGEEWIAFGDKEYFMPQNSANRIHCIATVQVSVDEVYDYFKSSKAGGTARKANATEFKALQMHPVPTVSIQDEKWFARAMYNPMDAWIAQVNEAQSQKWLCRAHVDNHSDYRYESGDPGYGRKVLFVSTPSAAKFRDAQFWRTNDAFLSTTTIECNVGILQLVQTSSTWRNAKALDDQLFLNVWSPVRFPNTDQDVPSGFTLRNQIRSVEVKENFKSAFPIHACRWFDGKKTMMLVFRLLNFDGWQKQRGELQVIASCYELTDPGQGKSSQFDFNLDSKQNKITCTTQFLDRNVSSTLNPPEKVSAFDLNKLKFCLFTNPSTGRPMLVGVIAAGTQINYNVTYLDSKTQNSTGWVKKPDWTQKSATSDPSWPKDPFVKAFKGVKSTRKIAFAQHSDIAADKSFNVGIASLGITDANGKEDFKITSWELLQKELVRGPVQSNQILSSCFLVGNILGAVKPSDGGANSPDQSDQVMSVTLSSNYTQFDIYGPTSAADSKLSSLCRHDCVSQAKSGNPDKYLRDYFIALVPGQYGTGSGLDVLHVSLYKTSSSNKYSLRFSTHINDRASRNGQPVPNRPGNQTDYFGSCDVNFLDDDLMTKERYESGRYQSMKWLFVPHLDSKKKNAIMEVFSWYGILGVRYFAADWDGKKYTYKQVGLQPFNGQTSMGLGLGIDGTWSAGLSTWGTDQDFIDVNHYNLFPMQQGNTVAQGYWEASANYDPKAGSWNDKIDLNKRIPRRESDFARLTPEGNNIPKLEA